MAKSWSTSGLDLHVVLAGGRVKAGLEQVLREAVRTRRLPPGARLPSSRSLAIDLGIARNTVADAYAQLVAEGWLVARLGSGTRVAEQAAPVESGDVPRTANVSRPRYDLRAGFPDLAAFPRSGWLAAARRALSSAPDIALGYSNPRGCLELRRALAGYLARARGVRVTPDRIVVCSGFTQGLGLLCQALRSRGTTTLAIEAYGIQSHRQVAMSRQLRLRTLPVDAGGAAIDTLGDATAVLLTPAHQFPLGVLLHPQRRSRAVEWAVNTAGLIIEDDYDGEFRYDRQPVGAMQALAPEHIAYAGTASKTLAPGLRLGWLVLPAHLVDAVVAAKLLADHQSSIFDQLTLAELISSGAYDRHVRWCRLAYARRRLRLIMALQRQAPDVRITGVAAGLHALLELPDGQHEEDIVARAAKHGLAVEGLRAYSASDSQSHPPALVVGYGTPPEHAFTAAVARLCAVLA